MDAPSKNQQKFNLFLGAQYKTKSCHWGGKPCVDTNEDQQVCHYCNGSKIQVCPINEDGYGNFRYIFTS